MSYDQARNGQTARFSHGHKHKKCVHATPPNLYSGVTAAGSTIMRPLARHLLTGLMMLFAASTARASEYIARDHVVIDLKFGIEWLRCSVGQVWDGAGCAGELVKLNQEEIGTAILQANEQLGGIWRLPTLEELDGLVCHECERPKINKKYFPQTSSEPYWTSNVNRAAKRHMWSVNFFTGHTYGRFFPYQQLAVRLVRDRR